MKVQTTRFGDLEIEESAAIEMPRGLIGLEHCTRFVLLEHQPGSPFGWLQSLDCPDLALLVTDPFQFFPDYELEVSDEDQRELGLSVPEDLMVLVTVTVRKDPSEVTANLLGPLVVNVANHRARQIILPGDRYKTRHPLELERREAA